MKRKGRLALNFLLCILIVTLSRPCNREKLKRIQEYVNMKGNTNGRGGECNYIVRVDSFGAFRVCESLLVVIGQYSLTGNALCEFPENPTLDNIIPTNDKEAFIFPPKKQTKLNLTVFEVKRKYRHHKTQTFFENHYYLST